MKLGNLRDRLNQSRRQHRDPEQLRQILQDLKTDAQLDAVYLILIIGSGIIATFGLLTNSAAVIIGAMIVAPLMLPIRALAMAALVGNPLLFRQGSLTVAIGTLLAIAISVSIGWLIPLPSFGSEVWSRSAPTLLDLGIAIAAGSISGYAKVEPRIAGSLAGTAIAVALMPPLCVIGLGLSHAEWSLSLGASLLYLTNLLGITLSCMLTFLIAGYSRFQRARRALTWAAILTVLLFIPLGISFSRLIRQAHLQTSLEQALLNRTLTFQRLQLLHTEVNWLTRPPEVRLSVRSQSRLTPRQVELLEAFISREMAQPFRLIFEVGQVEEIRSN